VFGFFSFPCCTSDVTASSHFYGALLSPPRRVADKWGRVLWLRDRTCRPFVHCSYGLPPPPLFLFHDYDSVWLSFFMIWPWGTSPRPLAIVARSCRPPPFFLPTCSVWESSKSMTFCFGSLLCWRTCVVTFIPPPLPLSSPTLKCGRGRPLQRSHPPPHSMKERAPPLPFHITDTTSTTAFHWTPLFMVGLTIATDTVRFPSLGNRSPVTSYKKSDGSL